MSYTPGPWSVVTEHIDLQSGEYSEACVIAKCGSESVTIAVVRVGLKGSDSNAQLIALAPTILETLHKVHAEIQDSITHNYVMNNTKYDAIGMRVVDLLSRIAILLK